MCFSIWQDPLELHHDEQSAYVPSYFVFSSKVKHIYYPSLQIRNGNLVQIQIIVE